MYNERFVVEENNEILNKIKNLGLEKIETEMRNELLILLTVETYDEHNRAMLIVDSVFIKSKGKEKIREIFIFSNSGIQAIYYNLLKILDIPEETEFYSDCFEYLFDLFEGLDISLEEQIINSRALAIVEENKGKVLPEAV